MKSLFFSLFFCVTFCVYCQDSIAIKKIEYLIKNKPTSDKDVHQIFKKSRKNKENVDLLLKRSKNASYLPGLYYGYSALGRIYRDHSHFNKSILEYNKALEIAKKSNKTVLELKILNAIGSVYRRQDDITNSLNYHQKALDIALAIENPSLEIKKSISISENSMGNIYITLGQYNLALKEFSSSIVVQKELNDILGLAINHQNMGSAKEELGFLDEALNHYYKSLAYNIEEKSETGKIICGYSIANILIKKRKYKQALVTVDTVLTKANKLGDMYYLSNTYNTLGLAQIYVNKLKAAHYNLDKALTIAKKFNVQQIKGKANENLALLYKKKNNFKKAYLYYKTAKEEEAKTFNHRNLLYVTELTTKYDKERSENKIKNLAKKSEIAELQRDRYRNVFLIITSSLALLIVIGYSIVRQRSLQNEKKLLRLKQEALQSQMSPHFIFNALNSIKLYIINNEQKNAVYYLNKFAKLIRKILEASKVKEISLREELETMELYMSIENIRFNNEINYSFTVDKSLNIDRIKIPPLVLQPFLENSIWHGLSSKKGEKKVTLSVQKTSDGFVSVLIEDNGIGRKASAKIKANKKTNKASLGVGLTSERLRSFVKDFSLKYTDVIKTNKVSGTKVCIRIPLV